MNRLGDGFFSSSGPSVPPSRFAALTREQALLFLGLLGIAGMFVKENRRPPFRGEAGVDDSPK